MTGHTRSISITLQSDAHKTIYCSSSAKNAVYVNLAEVEKSTGVSGSQCKDPNPLISPLGLYITQEINVLQWVAKTSQNIIGTSTTCQGHGTVRVRATPSLSVHPDSL